MAGIPFLDPVELAQLPSDPTGTFNAGATYFNTTLGLTRQYNGTTWFTLTPGSGGTPTKVASGAVYTVPVDTQVVTVLPIVVDGDLMILGDLVVL